MTITFLSLIPDSVRFLPTVLVVFVCLVPVERSLGQYDWSRHFGPQETGFEKFWFGEWDLEVQPLRGMLDWQSYGEPCTNDECPSRIARRAVRVDKSTGEERTVHSSYSLLVDRKETATIYLDPQTGKTVQRESLSYDDAGRLVEWRPVKDPKSVAFASTARTLYGVIPVGRSQHFAYFQDGTLQKWNACVADARGAESCDDTFVSFDRSGRIIGFGFSQTVYSLTRNSQGNLKHIHILNEISGEASDIDVNFDDIVIREKYADSLHIGMENIAAKGPNGRVIQYRIPSGPNSAQYSTTTWTYDAAGRLAAILKGLDSYSFGRDNGGRVVSVEQSVGSGNLTRSFNTRGALVAQSPPVRYNRYDLVESGTEQFSYSNDGALQTISVTDAVGAAVATLNLEYTYRKKPRVPGRQTSGK